MKNMIHKLVILSFLGACSPDLIESNGARHAKTYETRHPITIYHEQNSIELPIHPDGSDFTIAEQAKIKSYLYKFHDKSKSNLVITVPDEGKKVGLARQSVKRLIEIAQKLDITLDHIRVGTYKPFNNQIGGVRMSFETLKAHVPECSNNWTKNLTDAYNNEVSEMYGCSTRRNLAAMIAYPEDLIEERRMSVGISDRRVNTLDKYILGQSTSASRDASETASATSQ